MRIRALHTALLSAGLLLPAPRDHGPQRASSLRLISLRTEYLVDPLSIDTRIPRLSWIIDAGTARGVRQSAYQIEVASTPANLAADKADHLITRQGVGSDGKDPMPPGVYTITTTCRT